MGKMSPGFVRAQKAAEFLDMKPHEFRALVDAGALPQPASLDRWDVEELTAIMRGKAHKPKDTLDL